jgi:hypothetical protein
MSSFGPSRLALLPVLKESSATRKAQRDLEAKRTCRLQRFSKRLMGFEPTTFCMASRRSVREARRAWGANPASRAEYRQSPRWTSQLAKSMNSTEMSWV